MFLRIESVINKPLRSATGSWMAEVDGMAKGTHMHSVMALLSDDESYRVLAAIRMDHDPKLPTEKWCLLMHTRGGGGGQRDLGGSVFKERHITSPSRRNRNGHRHRKQGLDEGDLRFFEAERSQSRDRSAGLNHPNSSFVSPSSQKFDMNPSYYQRTPGRPMSLLNNPTVGLTLSNEGGTGSKALSSSSATTMSQTTRSQNTICSNFRNGDCKFGNKCRFKHTVGVGLESTASTNEQK
jgi:hypothetical protein